MEPGIEGEIAPVEPEPVATSAPEAEELSESEHDDSKEVQPSEPDVIIGGELAEAEPEPETVAVSEPDVIIGGE